MRGNDDVSPGNPPQERTIVIGRLSIRAILRVLRHHIGPQRETEMAYRIARMDRFVQTE